MKTKSYFLTYLQSRPRFLFALFQFVGGGHTTFCGFLNCFVHVVMYSYYFLAAPWIQPYLWWKRYITKLQMMQFIIFIVHALQPLFIECSYPKVRSSVQSCNLIYKIKLELELNIKDFCKLKLIYCKYLEIFNICCIRFIAG